MHLNELHCSRCPDVPISTVKGLLTHNRRVHGELPEIKHCSKCGHDKPLKKFNVVGVGTDGLPMHQSVCASCASHRGSKNQHTRNMSPAGQEARKARRWANYIKQTYGLSVEEYDAFMAKGVCSNEACRAVVKLGLDHCHVTGDPRDVLCANCNAALGRAFDDAEILRGLADYIEKHCSGHVSGEPERIKVG